jgi:hypothetical protein
VVQGMQQLTVVVLEGVQLDKLHLDNCASLKVLSIVRCASLRKVRLSAVAALEVLKVDRCEALQSVAGLRELRQLQQLHLLDCRSLTQLMAPSKAPRKMALSKMLCTPLPTLQDFHALRELKVIACPGLKIRSQSVRVLHALVHRLGEQVLVAQVNKWDLKTKRLSGQRVASAYSQSKLFSSGVSTHTTGSVAVDHLLNGKAAVIISYGNMHTGAVASPPVLDHVTCSV